MKKEKDKEKEKNPLHKEYGAGKNTIYIIKNMITYDKWMVIPVMAGIICQPIMNYLWTFISKYVIDMITGEKSVKELMRLMIFFGVFQLLASWLNSYYYSQWWRFIKIRFGMMTAKNRKIMKINYFHLENSDLMDCHEKANNACNSNETGIEGMMRQVVALLTNLSVVIVGLVILGAWNPLIMLLLAGVSTVNFIVNNNTNATTKKKVWDPLSTWWRKRSYMQHITTDFEAAKDIRMFNLRSWLINRYKALNQTRYEYQKKNNRLWLRASLISIILGRVSQVFVLGWLVYSIVEKNMSIGNFTLYLASTETFYNYITNLLWTISSLFARSREVDDFRSFMDFNGGDNETEGKEVPKYETYEFTFHNVSFCYPKSEKYALKNVNLTLKSGERLAVVGLNGAGKSTFIKLLLRLYEPTEGEILINGLNIAEFNRDSYYNIFAPVFQTVQLFAFPIAENVSMKAPNKTDKEKAKKNLIDAGFGDKLTSLEHGVDTEVLKVIHDDGIDLSGGEKQKLALARALYKEAPVIVLDEPTAALDALAEAKLYADFDKLIGNKTAVYISHRLSSTQFCHHVAMFVDGEMKEYGTHKSLMDLDGEYAKMFKVQAQYYVDENQMEVSLNG